MTGPPHLFAMTITARQRHADFQAEAARDRLARLAESGATRRRWPDISALAGIVLALALPFLTSLRD